jgi:hypothetical protein
MVDFELCVAVPFTIRKRALSGLLVRRPRGFETSLLRPIRRMSANDLVQPARPPSLALTEASR